MKEYQELIGKIIIAIAIVLAGSLVANALNLGFANIYSAIGDLGTLIRDGLLQIGSAS